MINWKSLKATTGRVFECVRLLRHFYVHFISPLGMYYIFEPPRKPKSVQNRAHKWEKKVEKGVKKISNTFHCLLPNWKLFCFSMNSWVCVTKAQIAEWAFSTTFSLLYPREELASQPRWSQKMVSCYEGAASAREGKVSCGFVIFTVLLCKWESKKNWEGTEMKWNCLKRVFSSS